MGLCSILVVEDDVLIRESLIEVLEDNGYAATGATNGQDALTRLETMSSPPDVILLDLMMPVMDGRGFREEQLRRTPVAEIPVVLLSASSDVSRQARELSVAAYLRKPVTLRALLDELRRYCDPAPAL